jgi:E3 ubiquitin-protein ligase synoviolin
MVATVCTIFHALSVRQHFYPTMQYLLSRKHGVMALSNFALVMVVQAGTALKKIFFGTLRTAEVEVAYEMTGYAVTETCFSLAVFAPELITIQVGTLFSGLLFLKIFHWLCQERVIHLEQMEETPALAQFRLFCLMVLLNVLDVACVVLSSRQIFLLGWKNAGVLLLFAFDALIVLVGCASTTLRFFIHLINQSYDSAWRHKASFIFTLELLTEICRTTIYLVFVVAIYYTHGSKGLVYVAHDFWRALHALQSKIVQFVQWYAVMQHLNDRFRDTTEEDLETAGDVVCIVCREDMLIGQQRLKTLDCGHAFHRDCLQLWLQQQSTCPTCRSVIELDRRGAGANPRRHPLDGGIDDEDIVEGDNGTQEAAAGVQEAAAVQGLQQHGTPNGDGAADRSGAPEAAEEGVSTGGASGALRDGWVEHNDANTGRSYYVHPAGRRTTWTRPEKEATQAGGAGTSAREEGTSAGVEQSVAVGSTRGQAPSAEAVGAEAVGAGSEGGKLQQQQQLYQAEQRQRQAQRLLQSAAGGEDAGAAPSLESLAQAQAHLLQQMALPPMQMPQMLHMVPPAGMPLLSPMPTPPLMSAPAFMQMVLTAGAGAGVCAGAGAGAGTMPNWRQPLNKQEMVQQIDGLIAQLDKLQVRYY